MDTTTNKNECICNGDCGGNGMMAKLDEIIISHKDKPGALIPVLQATQSLFGYIPADAIKRISEGLDETLSKIYGVITFYSFFSLKPRGKYLIRVCLGTACYVRGAEEVLTALKQQLGVGVGGTSDDLLFTLDVGRCFGACGLAPVIMINDDVHQWVKPSEIEKILKSYRNKKTADAGGN